MSRLHSNLTRLKQTRKVLRSSLTSAEIALWLALKGRQLEGRKFRRQHSMGSYVLDFFCPEENLGIELDGVSHDSAPAQAHDASRTVFLQSLGIRVLRYENRDVLGNLEGVLKDICSNFRR